jgi:hypothetical protein
MQTRQVASQFFKVIAGRRPQITIVLSIVHHLELTEESALDIGGNAWRSFVVNEEGAEPLVPKTYDHALNPSM